MNRRTFLASSLTTGAFAITSISAGSAADNESRSNRQPVRIGFLGMSHSHARGKLKVVQESSAYQLIGLCENDARVRSRFEGSGAQSISKTDLISRAELIAVESDVKDHARDAKLALQAGKHVHLEKAPTDSLESFAELLAIARSKRKLLQMGYMWRYHPGINRALTAARKGWLGKVYLVRATINTNIGPEQRRQLEPFRGGMMFELGAHLIDPIVRLLGRPAKVTPFLRQTGAFTDKLADNTTAVFEYPDAMAIVASSTPQPNASSHRLFEIQGTRGTALVNPIEPPRLEIDLAEAAGPYQSGRHAVPLEDYQRYAPELADLADAIRNNRPLAITPDEDLLVHQTLMRACEMNS